MSPVPERSDWYRAKMHYVYILQSQKDNLLYVGYTTNIKARLLRHNKGLVEATRYRRPLALIFCEGFSMRKDALRRERYFKTAKGKTTLKMMLREYFSVSNEKRYR